MDRLKRSALSYLNLLPLTTAAIGFGIGPVSYLIYVPLWLLHTGLLLLLLKKLANNKPSPAVILLILPWLLFSIFAGMGPPPSTPGGWLASATEQAARYTILITGGLSAYTGFALLKTKLQNPYATIGFALLTIAIPLFILNMAYWGYFLTSAFRLFSTLPGAKRPDWYPPIKAFFYIISLIEASLIYLASLCFAVALKKAQLLTSRASNYYLIFALIAIFLLLLSPSIPEPIATFSYLAAIPAIAFVMPYLMGIRLLRLPNP